MSDVIDLFHDSIWALSFMRRGRFADCTRPASAKWRLKSPARNSIPRSLWKSVSQSARRVRSAEARARRVKAVVRSDQGPTQQPTRMAVHDGGQVAPVTADLEISDVDNPDLVGSINLDRMCPAFDAGQERCQPRASPVQPCRTGPDNYFSHQTLDPTPADRLALPVQRRMHPGAAEGLKAVVVHRLNILDQLGVVQ